MKYGFAKIILMVLLLIEVSCGNDIPDCPTKLCVLAGGWRLVEVRVDGIKDTSSDLSKYKLTLYMPNPTTAVTSDFDRVNPSGRQDTGAWELRNNSSVLALLPANTPEESYIIKDFSPRQLILVIDREDDKTGPNQYEYLLEPF
jgi:hypothetical protein